MSYNPMKGVLPTPPQVDANALQRIYNNHRAKEDLALQSEQAKIDVMYKELALRQQQMEYENALRSAQAENIQLQNLATSTGIQQADPLAGYQRDAEYHKLKSFITEQQALDTNQGFNNFFVTTEAGSRQNFINGMGSILRGDTPLLVEENGTPIYFHQLANKIENPADHKKFLDYVTENFKTHLASVDDGKFNRKGGAEHSDDAIYNMRKGILDLFEGLSNGAKYDKKTINEYLEKRTKSQLTPVKKPNPSLNAL